MIKIAFLVNTFPTLTEPFVSNKIIGLLKKGYTVDIISGRCDGNEKNTHHEYNISDHTYYINVPASKTKRIFTGCVKLFRYLFSHPRVVFNFFILLRGFDRPIAWKYLFSAEIFMEHGHYDIVHCIYGSNGGIGILHKEAGIIDGKLITSFHGFDMSERILNSRLYTKLKKKGDLFLPVCNYFKNKLIQYNFPEDKIIVHHTSININQFKLKERIGEINEVVKILTVGRLTVKKGIEYSIRAIGSLVKKYPIRYIIIGDGELREALDHLIKSLDASEYIQLINSVSRDELVKYYISSDILIAPSIATENGNIEGIPNVLKEAMSCGLPVISTWHSGIPELVRDGKNGYLVPERDPEAIAERLEYLINHPDVLPRLARCGRSEVEQRFDSNKLNNHLVDIYKNVLD